MMVSDTCVGWGFVIANSMIVFVVERIHSPKFYFV
jgi:hypothetical protein